MDKFELIEAKVKTCVKLIKGLREQNAKISKSHDALLQERNLLEKENHGVRKIMIELDKLKNERKVIAQKLERLNSQYRKIKLKP